MDTRTSIRWKCKPGGFDALNTGLIHGDEDYPILSSHYLNAGFTSVSCNNYCAYGSNSLVNMFVDDYVLERFWRNPTKYVARFKSVAAVMSPDFSLFIGMPRPLLQFNVYRNRFVGSVWLGFKILFLSLIYFLIAANGKAYTQAGCINPKHHGSVCPPACRVCNVGGCASL